MLAVGGAEEDGTVIELERIQETAHRALDLIVHVVMVDGNQLGHELVELNRFFEGPPALTCREWIAKPRWRHAALGTDLVHPSPLVFHAAYRMCRSSP